MAERFGGWPWDVDEAPTDRVLYYRQILGIEAEVRQLTAGLASDEPLYLEG